MRKSYFTSSVSFTKIQIDLNLISRSQGIMWPQYENSKINKAIEQKNYLINLLVLFLLLFYCKNKIYLKRKKLKYQNCNLFSVGWRKKNVKSFEYKFPLKSQIII